MSANPATNEDQLEAPHCYEILVAGQLDHRWSEWFHGIEIQTRYTGSRVSHTLLRCSGIDQARLRGILNKLWDLNLNVVSMRCRAGPPDTMHRQDPHNLSG